MENKYSTTFNSFVCTGDTISADIDGLTITARIVLDDDYSIDDDDIHNTDQSVTGCNDEQQEKLLAARRCWFNNEWFYCGVVASVSKNDVTLDSQAASLWGIEANYPGSNNDHLTEVANELFDEALQTAKETLKELCA